MVEECHYSTVTVSSDAARAHAATIAAAASEGLITTWVPDTGYGRVWRATTAGLLFLETGEL